MNYDVTSNVPTYEYDRGLQVKSKHMMDVLLMYDRFTMIIGQTILRCNYYARYAVLSTMMRLRLLI